VERAARWLIREVQVSILLDHCRRPGQICSHAYMVLYLTCRAS
jgi:hypothetical protein